MKCKKCGNTRFSVRVVGYQDYDGEDNEYFDAGNFEIEGEKPYMCIDCGEDFDFEELEK